MQIEQTSNSNNEANHPSPKPTIVTNPYKPNRGSGNQTVNTRENRLNSGASTQSTMNTKNIPFIPINDGTVRMTIKWKPTSDNYFDYSENQTLWESEALLFLQKLFDQPESQQPTFIPWAASTTNNPKKISEIIAEQSFNQYRSPRIAKLDSREQFIFGIRVCLGTTSPGPWITNSITQ
jgi:hypothetical protein